MKTPDTIQRLADLFAVPNDTIRDFLEWHDGQMHEYGKELQGKILDQEFTIKSLVEDNIALKEAIEINCNCNADGCQQAKLLQDKDYQIQEAWEKVHALEDDLHNSETKNDLLVNEKNEAFTLLAQCTLRRNASEMRIEELKKQLNDVAFYNKNINDELRKADSHNLTLTAKIQVYEEQWQPSKQEQIDELSDKFDALDDEYQDLVIIATDIFRGIPRFELTALLPPDKYERFKNHLGV